MLLLTGALWVLRRELSMHHPREILAAIRAVPWRSVALALGITAVGYAVLPAYDAIGLRYLGRRLGVGRTMLVGFLSYSFSQTLGFALLTGGSIRYRLYSAWGLSAAEIAQVIALAAMSFWLGVATVGGISLVASPAGTLAEGPFPVVAMRVAGTLLLAVPVAYLVVARVRRRPIAAFGWELPPPEPALPFAQVFVGCVDWCIAAAAAYILLPPETGMSFLAFLGVFVLAQVVGLVSHVPGGIGVFESVVVILMGSALPSAVILGSLLVFRVTYYLVPFATGAVVLSAYELRARRATVARVARAAATWLPALAPRAVAAITFAGGTVLLFSGALPAEGTRLAWLADLVPLSVIEISHFLGSIAGLGLVILAWGLAHRLDAAYHLSLLALAVGMAMSLLKGVDYEEAVVLGFALIVLLATRRHFYRRASLLHEPLSAPWLVALGTALVAMLWLGLFAHRHVTYQTELWWQFTLHGDASRFLRATVGVLVGTAGFGLARLIRPALPAPVVAHDLDRVRRIMATSDRTTASLALLGDKRFVFDDDGTGFIMYGVSGRSWIAMGDPVGVPTAYSDLVWRFRELADEHAGRIVFYQVGPETLPLYLDLGLRLLKIGEEALVPLQAFTLDGGHRRGLRRTKRQVEAEGCTFGLLAAAEVPAILDELRGISDTWLASRETREKGFSLGRFDPTYLVQFPVAVVRRNDRIVAFANVWTTTTRAELSLDLMRYRPDAPSGVMEYLFVELMRWGSTAGYEHFNLGVVPLSGMDQRALAPLWNRLSTLVYRHGEHFYNFQGLRTYKEKFDPVWRPRYLAAPGGFSLPAALADVAALISGGLTGVVWR